MKHLLIFREIVSDVVSLEVKYEDKDLTLLPLVSLPSSFTNFRDTLFLSRDESTISKVDEVLQQREVDGSTLAGTTG
jgi:hypothetical protein